MLLCLLLKVLFNFAWWKSCCPSFLFISCTECLYSSSHFQCMCVSLDLKWVFCRQHKGILSLYPIQPLYVIWLDHLVYLQLNWLLITVYLLPLCTLLLRFCFVLFFSLLLPSSGAIAPCDLMIILLFFNFFLLCICVSIIDSWFVVMRVYI